MSGAVPLSTVCKNYAEHYANNPSIQRAIAASSEMETMLRQMFGSCISGEGYPEQRHYPRAQPVQGPVTGMIIEATNSQNHPDYTNSENRQNIPPRSENVNNGFGNFEKNRNDQGRKQQIEHGIRSNALHPIDDDMSAITALTLEEMEKMNKRRNELSMLGDDAELKAQLHRKALSREHLQRSRMQTERSNDTRVSRRQNLSQRCVGITQCVPSSRFEPKFDAFNLYQNNEREVHNSEKNDYPSKKRQETFPNTTDNKFSMNKEKRKISFPRIVTPPKSSEWYSNFETEVESSKSSSSKSVMSSRNHSHPHDNEMKSLDKTFVKSRLNSLQNLVNDSQAKVTKNHFLTNEMPNAEKTKRSQSKKLRGHQKCTSSFMDDDQKILDRETALMSRRSSPRQHVYRMEMFDGSILEYTDDEKFGEI